MIRAPYWRQLAAVFVILALHGGAAAAQGDALSGDAGVSDAAPNDPWAKTLARVAPSVVSLEIANQRSFTDSRQGLSTATGFVVDAERGIILTNRHVVGSGPISASATFQNQERLEVWPLYRDPVHDFGFLRYDPSALRHLRPKALELRPDKVSKGLSIRVIGSDGGEQLSILAGTIARTDRPAPRYGRYSYNDFNTFYLQAASGTSGGSSGSPVIDVAGDAVALNAGANRSTASSFFLPLARVRRALQQLQRDEPVSRGTLDVLWSHQPYRELRRLGLSAEREDTLRAAAGEHLGLLLASQVLPAGVADGQLMEGDILLSVDAQPVADFITLESLLDTRIGQSVGITLLRQGEEMQLELAVGDLHQRHPEALLEFGGGVLHEADLQRARAMHHPRRGLVLAETGYLFARAGVPQGALITDLGGEPLDTLAQFIERLKSARHGDRWLLRFRVAGEKNASRLAQLQIDGRWFDSRHCLRRDDAPNWDCQTLQLAAGEAPPETPVELPVRDGLGAALVRVEFNIPHPVDNVYARHFKGGGLLLDPARGLVAVDRNTVPVSLGDAQITLFGALTVPAEVVFLHPRHNIALLRYDPALLGEQSVPTVQLASGPLPTDEPLQLIGIREDGSLLQQAVQRPTPHTLKLPKPRLPRFSQVPLDSWVLPGTPPSLGGAVVDQRGQVHGLWTSFAYDGEDGITEGEWLLPAELLREALELYLGGQPLYALEAELGYLPLARARTLGLPNDWLQRLAKAGGSTPRVLLLSALAAGSDAADKLRPGDLLLAVDGQLVSRLREVEILANRGEVELTLLRDQQLQTVRVSNPSLPVDSAQRLLHFAGAYLQAPPWQMALQHGLSPKGVYVGWVAPGSPAHRDGLYRNLLITAVNGEDINGLEDLRRALEANGEADILRLSLMDLSGRKRVIGLRRATQFWATYELSRSADGWQRRAL